MDPTVRINDLLGERAALLSDMRGALDIAAKEKRGLSVEENKTHQRREARVAEIDKTIGELRDEDARDRERILRSLPRERATKTPSNGPVGQLRSQAYRAVESAVEATDNMRQRGFALIDQDTSGEASRWTIAASDPDYLSAFSKLVADPERGHLQWTEDERRAFDRARTEQRAMSLTDANGGYLVPFQLDPSIVLTNTGAINPLRVISRKVVATSDVWNGVASSGVTAEWLGEGTEAADASPTVSQPTISIHKGSAYVPYSFEVGMDAPNLVEELGRLLSDAKDRLEATAFTVGSGSGQPAGIVTRVAATAGSRVTSATADTYAVADVYAVGKALPARHRASASWCAHPSIAIDTRQFATGTGPSHAFWTDLGGDTPPKLLGKSFYEVSDMDGTVAQNNDILLYGDFSNFVIADRVGTVVELIPNVVGTNRRPTGQRGIFMWWRVGADCVNADAFRILRA